MSGLWLREVAACTLVRVGLCHSCQLVQIVETSALCPDSTSHLQTAGLLKMKQAGKKGKK